jgi:hypothetical protein
MLAGLTPIRRQGCSAKSGRQAKWLNKARFSPGAREFSGPTASIKPFSEYPKQPTRAPRIVATAVLLVVAVRNGHFGESEARKLVRPKTYGRPSSSGVLRLMFKHIRCLPSVAVVVDGRVVGVETARAAGLGIRRKALDSQVDASSGSGDSTGELLQPPIFRICETLLAE